MNRLRLRIPALLATLAALGMLTSAVNCGSGSISLGAHSASVSAKAVLPANDTDVAGMRFSILPVNCDDGQPAGDLIVQDRPLEDQVIPGNSGDLQNNPLDEGSAHLFVDLFIVLEPGCYDIQVTPMTDKGEASADCAAAWKTNVSVPEGDTVEIMLINQCEGDDPGAADIIAALNREPVILDVVFTDSKFVCGGTAEICAEAMDADSDPLAFELVAGHNNDCVITSSGDPEGTPLEGVTQCWQVQCHEWGKADHTLLVYDLVWSNGELIPVEQFLAIEGYPNESHAEMDFFSRWDGIKFYPDADGDGHGDASAPAILVCEGDDPPAGHVTVNDDCDDANATTYPGAEELCADGVDNDCDGEIDEDCSQCTQGHQCGTYTPQECQCGSSGVCAQTAEGGAECVDGATSCGGLPDCAGSSDCPNGGSCIVNSCCNRAVCVAPPNLCLEPSQNHTQENPPDNGELTIASM